MEKGFNPLDPLGIFGRVKMDIDRIAGSAKLPAPPILPGLTTKPGKTIGNPIPMEFNGKLINMREEAKQKLLAAGYRLTIVDSALNWHDEWLMGLVRMMAPDDTNMQRTLVQKAYSEIAPRAERWMRGIQNAFGVTN